MKIGDMYVGKISSDVRLEVVSILPDQDTVKARVVSGKNETLDYVLSTFDEYYTRCFFVGQLAQSWHAGFGRVRSIGPYSFIVEFTANNSEGVYYYNHIPRGLRLYDENEWNYVLEGDK